MIDELKTKPSLLRTSSPPLCASVFLLSLCARRSLCSRARAPMHIIHAHHPPPTTQRTRTHTCSNARPSTPSCEKKATAPRRRKEEASAPSRQKTHPAACSRDRRLPSKSSPEKRRRLPLPFGVDIEFRLSDWFR